MMSRLFLEATTRIELVIKVLQTSALPLGYVAISVWSGLRGSNSLPPPWQGGALPDELNPQHSAYIRLLLFGDPNQTRTDDLLRDRQAF